MRYYELDSNGWPLASYARPQTDKELRHLPDQPNEHHRWDGEKWVEDADAKLAAEWEAMVLTRYQARAALLNAGLLDDVEALMADAETPREIVLMWQHKERIRRTHEATVQMAGALGWTDEQLDDLFRQGMQIEP